MYGLGYFIKWIDMDFGSVDNQQCGICNCPNKGWYKCCELQQDNLCYDCIEQWTWDIDEEYGGGDIGYVRTNFNPAALLIEGLINLKMQQGFGDVCFTNWFFYFDNEQLSVSCVRKNWNRSKYRYWSLS